MMGYTRLPAGRAAVLDWRRPTDALDDPAAAVGDAWPIKRRVVLVPGSGLWLGRRACGEDRSMDAITLLKQDHKTVEGLFKKFEKTGPSAHVAQRHLAEKIIQELSVHAAIEEQVFYPAVREAVPATEDHVLEALEEHHIVKWVASELDGMSPDAERFRAKMTVLIESVRHHVEEEETQLFPEVRKAMGRKALGGIGVAMEEARKVAPTRPHPKAPDTPPANVAAGAGAALVDKARNATRRRLHS